MTFNQNEPFKHKLAWALALSVSCHLLVLWMSSGRPTSQPELISPLTWQVTLGEGHAMVRQPVKKNKPAQQPARKQAPQPEPAHPVTAAAIPDPGQTAKSENAYSPENEQLAQTQVQVLSYLQQEMNNHFVYPRLARRNGWQGTVLLRIDIESDGMISKIHLLSSSGYRILDDSAIEAVSKIHRVSSHTGQDSLYVDIPVIYQLKQG